MKAKSVLESYEFVANQFRNNKKVIYSRFGDGDIFIMMGKDQQNHKANPKLANELKEAFAIRDMSYLKGVSINYPFEKGMIYGLFEPFASNQVMLDYVKNEFSFSEEELFESPIFLHYLSVYNPLMVNVFLDEHIRTKRKMFIGSVAKGKIENLIDSVDYHVTVPPKNSYETIDEWWPEVIKNIHDVELVIPAAGMSTRVINKRLWEMDLQIQSFDIGSLVDAADGRGTRRWLRIAGHRTNKILLTRKKTLWSLLHYGLRELKFKVKLMRGK